MRVERTNRRKQAMARVLISMPEEFLSKIDKLAEVEQRSRSELIREALRTYIVASKIRENNLANKNATILESLLD
jgi:CopG family transcriptional regulator / antitoxin EndoAI